MSHDGVYVHELWDLVDAGVTVVEVAIRLFFDSHRLDDIRLACMTELFASLLLFYRALCFSN